MLLLCYSFFLLNAQILTRNKLQENCDNSFYTLFLLCCVISLIFHPKLPFLHSNSLLPKISYNIFIARNWRQKIYSITPFFKKKYMMSAFFFKWGCLPTIHTFNYSSLVWNSLSHYFILQFQVLFLLIFALPNIFWWCVSRSHHGGNKQSRSKKQLQLTLWMKLRCRLLVFLPRINSFSSRWNRSDSSLTLRSICRWL